MTDRRQQPTRDELIERLRIARSERDDEALVAAAESLKVAAGHGNFEGALSEAWPDLKRPAHFLSRKRKQLDRRRRKVDVQLPGPLDDSAIALYERLRRAAMAPPPLRRNRLVRISRETGLSGRTLDRKLRELGLEGARALNRKPRSDAGNVRVPDEVRQAFVDRRTSKGTKHEAVAVSIKRMREQFPSLEISEHSLRRLARSIPKALTMKPQDWRATFLPGRQWEVPYPNHTHTFDMTIADLFVWDRDPQVEPYRPHLTAIVDEHTHCCMFGLYSKEPPSRAVLQTLLLHAWLPKPDPKWPMYGAPEHLHCDNGKVQDSDWLEAVCRTLGAGLNLCGDIRHAAVRSPWQQGHIERFFGIVHSHLESQLGACYCGNSPKNRPECFEDKSGGLKVWQKYPTIEALNQAFWIWVAAEYHQLHHRRLGMTRLDAWQLQSPGHVRLPDRDYLYETLLQRAGKRRVTNGRVRLNTFTYWHRLLQGYEGTDLEVRWDPADLGRALVFDFRGQPLCQAQRDERKFVDDPADLAEHRQRQREIKVQKKVLAEAIAAVAPTDERTYREHVEALDEAHRKQVIPFPGGVRPEKPEPDEELTIEELLELYPEQIPDLARDDFLSEAVRAELRRRLGRDEGPYDLGDIDQDFPGDSTLLGLDNFDRDERVEKYRQRYPNYRSGGDEKSPKPEKLTIYGLEI